MQNFSAVGRVAGKAGVMAAVRFRECLKREIPRLIEKETAGAVQLAILDLEEHGEIDQMELPAIRNRSYTEEQILGDWFPEEPRR